VSAERDRLQETNADIREELQRVRQQLMRSSTAAAPSLAAQRVLKQVEMVSDFIVTGVHVQCRELCTVCLV